MCFNCFASLFCYVFTTTPLLHKVRQCQCFAIRMKIVATKLVSISLSQNL
uniref:Uncharacterized protein n=1 Tax=Rhizophora mucronata TaxID=61149 RepID=A0A2P2KW86_RHIMU